jgi:hypothetical protein
MGHYIILEEGNEETIDGLTSIWVKVRLNDNNRAVRRPQFLNSFGNSSNIKIAEFAAILRQIRQTYERTGRVSNKSNNRRSKKLNKRNIK